MKKILIGILIGLFLSSTVVIAKDVYEVYKATFDVYVNSNKLITNNDALAINGTTYLSLKDLCNALDINIVWNEDEHRVEVGDCTSINTIKNNEVGFTDDDYYYFPDGTYTVKGNVDENGELIGKIYYDDIGFWIHYRYKKVGNQFVVVGFEMK